MAEVIFVRHAQPLYDEPRSKEFPCELMEFSNLSEKGVDLALKTAKKSIFSDAQLVVASPYTRALQTAAYIAIENRLSLEVAADLYEWRANLLCEKLDRAEIKRRYNEYKTLRGEYPDGQTCPFERRESVRQRAHTALAPYLSHKKIVVVSHMVVMQQFISPDDFLNFDFCEIRVKNIVSSQAPDGSCVLRFLD